MHKRHTYTRTGVTQQNISVGLFVRKIYWGVTNKFCSFIPVPQRGENKSKIVLQWVHPFSDISMQDAQYSVEHPVSSLYKYLRAAKVSLYQESWDLRKLLLKRGLFGVSRLCTLTFRELSFSCLTYTFKEIKWFWDATNIMWNKVTR